jgi:sulfate adenylyltransferase subunit 1
MSVTLTIEDDIDISRGDMIVGHDDSPAVSQDLELMVCWLDPKRMIRGGKYALRHTTRDARCVIKDVRYKLNINTLEHDENDKEVGVNDVARIAVRTTAPLAFDEYRRNRATGSVILIDEATNVTVGAGMIVAGAPPAPAFPTWTNDTDPSI